MNRSSLAVAAALAASAALLLTACGGSDGPDKISPAAPVPPSASATTAPPATAPAAAGPKAPRFDLPTDVRPDFKGFDSTDPDRRAALRDASYAATAVLEFEARTPVKETPNFKRYFTGARGARYADSIIAQGRDGSVITGTYHYYSPAVKPLQGGSLAVTYCEDQRKAYGKDARTGKVTVTTPSPGDFRQWTLLMAKGPAGDWQVFDHTWVKGAAQCHVA